MSKYGVKIKKLAMLATPTSLRKPVFSSLLFAAVSPLQHLQQRSNTYRDDTTYLLAHNGQVCHLRAMLNDYFDATMRRITVMDNMTTGEAVTVHEREVGRFEMISRRTDLRPLKLYRRGYGGVGGYDFWVNVPCDVEASDARIRAMVNIYKLASKRFNINRT